MVQSRKVELEVKIEVNIPLDIINNKERLREVENGLIRSISNGLYQQAITIKLISKLNSGFTFQLNVLFSFWAIVVTPATNLSLGAVFKSFYNLFSLSHIMPVRMHYFTKPESCFDTSIILSVLLLITDRL
jgi:hypothetical protein